MRGEPDHATIQLAPIVGRALRQVIRSLSRSPAYTTVALLSIGGGIALTCSIWAVIAATFFVDPPVVEPDRLVDLWQTASATASVPQDAIQPLRMEDWVAEQPFETLEEVAASGIGPTLVLHDREGAERVSASAILGDWFGVLGARAERGRILLPEDLGPGAPQVVVVSHRFWRDDLAGGELGTISLSGTPYTVVGVMPAAFTARRTVWVPHEALPQGARPSGYNGLGRLRRGASIQQAALEVQNLAAVQVQTHSARYGSVGATARRFGELARTSRRPELWLLAGVALTVLLVGVNNLTMLTLARAQARHPMLAVRASLGASRLELGRDLALEGALLGFGGSVGGWLLAFWGKDVAAAVLPGAVLPVLGFGSLLLAMGLGLVASLALGLEPIRRLGTLDLREVLQRRGGGSSGTLGERRTRQLLVSTQVAVSVVLLAVGTALAAAYREWGALELGFDAAEVIEVFPDWEIAALDPRQQWLLADRLADRLEALPDVGSATAWRMIGEDFPPRPDIDAVIDGAPLELDPNDRLYRYYEVRPGFFSTLGIPILEGRQFSERDDRGSIPVAVVTQRAARLWWPGTNALGRQVRLGQSGVWMTVIGVAGDIHQLDELGRTQATRSRPAAPLLFVPFGQFESPPPGWRTFSCCTGVRIGARAEDPARTTQVVRAMMAREAPGVPLVHAGSLHEVQMDGYQGDLLFRNGAMVAVGLLIALGLALVGIAGMVAESLNRRRRELGVRLALGATGLDVLWTMGRDSLFSASLGLVAGAATLIALRGWIESAFFGVTVQRLAPSLMSLEVLGFAMAILATLTVLSVFAAARPALRTGVVEALRND